MLATFIAFAFGSNANLLLLLLSFFFRAARSSHDGLSQRATFFYSAPYADHLYGVVGWWPWHLLNWAGRDLFIALLYLRLWQQNCPWQTLCGAIFINWLLHDFLYWFFFSQRANFRWGMAGVSLPSFFKRKFAPNPNAEN